jgi:HEAT repeat protein
MKRLILALALCGLLAPAAPLFAADAGDEQRQIELLASDASLQQKDTACLRLKEIGTAKAVPALAALLPHERLSQAARNALECLPYPAAGQALVDALEKTTGLTQAGIIDSLGFRREKSATPQLVKLLNHPNAVTSAATAAALGKIGTPSAVDALQKSLANAQGLARAAALEGLLTAANTQLAEGGAPAAAATFEALYKSKEADFVREAAYKGMIRAAGAQALPLVLAGIKRDDLASQRAAMQLARDVQDPGATLALAGLLPAAPPVAQIALLEVLNQRADPAAAPAVLALAKSPEPAVRAAAFNALGVLGDASAVPALITGAAAADKAEQKAARQTLLLLPQLTDALLAQLNAGAPAAQAEIIRALGARSEKGNAAKLLNIAQTGPASARPLALRALTPIAGNADLPGLVRLLIDTKDEALRGTLQDTLISICQRLQGQPGFTAAFLLDGLRQGQPADRAALFPVTATLADAQIRTILRAAATDAEPLVKTAALRALCDTRDAELLPDLLALARATAEANLRTLALRGYTRLVADEENPKLTPAQRVERLKPALELAQNAAEKRLVLSGLAAVPDPSGLPLALPLLADAATRQEAAQAVTRIAGQLAAADPDSARQALRQVIETADSGQRQAAQATLKRVDEMASYLTDWQVAGPYRQEGKNFAALFDIPFGPEIPGAQAVNWRRLPRGTDPQQPGLLDLLKFLGGEQCVAYAQTRIYSAIEQDARLELGTDDGVKAWLNQAQIHANNVARPLTAESDSVNIHLKSGWNTLRLKITQNGMGWEFRVRLVKPDGGPLEGIKVDSKTEDSPRLKEARAARKTWLAINAPGR